MLKLSTIMVVVAAVAVVLVSADYKCANQPSTKDAKDE